MMIHVHRSFLLRLQPAFVDLWQSFCGMESERSRADSVEIRPAVEKLRLLLMERSSWVWYDEDER